MFERFTEGARQIVVIAQTRAHEHVRDRIPTEALLVALVEYEDGLAARVLHDLGVTEIPKAWDTYVEEPLNEGAEPGTPTGQIPFTAASKKVLELALREALSLGHNYIGTEHILLGLMCEGTCNGAKLLSDFATPDAVRERVIKFLSSTPTRSSPTERRRRELDRQASEVARDFRHGVLHITRILEQVVDHTQAGDHVGAAAWLKSAADSLAELDETAASLAVSQLREMEFSGGPAVIVRIP